jgi:hypothetical protein
MFNYQYGFNYNLTKSLKVNYNATSNNIVRSYIDENDMPDSPEEFSQLKERILSKEMFRGSIVSEDGTATIIVFSLFDEANIQALWGERKTNRSIC